MDILLVHPNASKDIYQSLADEYSAIEPPLWAALLANALRNKGHEVGILDCEAEGLSILESANKILEVNPRIVAIVVYGQQPSASTQNMYGAEKLARYLENNVTVIFVGAHPSALPYRTVLDNPKCLVAVGEGIDTLDALGKLNLLEDIPGLVYYKEKEIVQNMPATLCKNLAEELPGMALDLLPMEKYRTSNWHSWSNNNERQPFASIYTSLGCPYKCSFCMINAPFGKNVFRYWDPEFTIKELEKISDMGIRNLKIADEMFVLKPKHFMTLAELIIKRGFDFNIWCYARIDTVKEKYLETLKKAGVNWLALGIESANKEVRQDVVKGGYEDVDINNIVKTIKDYGINVIGNFIVGLPEDNEKSMRETLEYAKKLKCEMLNIYAAMAYPGSKLYSMATELERYNLPDNWLGYSQHSYNTYPLGTKWIRSETVLAFRDKVFNEYFSNEDYLDYMKNKFGINTYNDIKKMASHKLKRKHCLV